MTQHVATRISAQVRSHAQKVLKDYSPNQNLSDMNDSEAVDGVGTELLSQHHIEPDHRTADIVGDAEGGSNEGLLNLNQ